MHRESKFIIDESTHTGMVRRAANLIALDLGFDEIHQVRISIVVNELATNILKHAKRGEMILIQNKNSLSILAIDKTPGISNLSESLKDGYSTTGTAGNGLGAIRRLSNHFDLYTQIGKGTVVLAVFSTEPDLHPKFVCSGFSLPMKGEEVSGDSWSFKVDDSSANYQILVADGLGHGIFANEASRAAVIQFDSNDHASPLVAVNNIHGSLKSTRGAAIAVAFCSPDKAQVEYCGLGNISGTVVSFTSVKRLTTFNGTAGLALRKTQSLTYPMTSNHVLIIHSDGIGTQWNMADYPGLLLKDPLIIAGILYRDFNRENDDVTVIVAKENL